MWQGVFGVWSLPDSSIRDVGIGSIVKMLNPEVIRQSSCCFHLVIVHFCCRGSCIVMVEMDWHLEILQAVNRFRHF